MIVGCEGGGKVLFLGNAKIPPPLTLKEDTWHLIVFGSPSVIHTVSFYYFTDKYNRKIIRADRDVYRGELNVVIDRGDFKGTIGVTKFTLGDSPSDNQNIISIRELGAVMPQELQDDSSLR